MGIAATVRAWADRLSARVFKRNRADLPTPRPGSYDTIENVAAALAAATLGNLEPIVSFYETLAPKDPHLLGVRRQLRAGVLATKWEIQPGDESPSAKEAADALRAAVMAARFDLRGLLGQLVEFDLMGAGIVETIWNDPEEPARLPIGWVAVDPRRNRVDFETLHLAIAESRFDYRGVPVSEFPRGKFLEMLPDAPPSDPSLWGVYRALLEDWLLRRDVHYWEAQYLERFNQPNILIHADDDGDRQIAKSAMQSFGSTGALLVRTTTKAEMFGGPQGTKILHEEYLEQSGRRMSIAVVGQEQTTSIQKGAGSKASAAVQSLVRDDVLADTCGRIARVLDRDLAGPFCELRYGPTVAAPKWLAKLDKPAELSQLGDAFGKLQTAGMDISRGEAYELTALTDPTPEAGKVLVPRAPSSGTAATPTLPGASGVGASALTADAAPAGNNVVTFPTGKATAEPAPVNPKAPAEAKPSKGIAAELLADFSDHLEKARESEDPRLLVDLQRKLEHELAERRAGKAPRATELQAHLASLVLQGAGTAFAKTQKERAAHG